MSKVIIRDYHVEVTVDDNDSRYVGGILRTEKKKESLAEDIAAAIQRHVDLDGPDCVHVVCTVKSHCSFCGAKWTETGDHNGGCCDDDLAAIETAESGVL